MLIYTKFPVVFSLWLHVKVNTGIRGFAVGVNVSTWGRNPSRAMSTAGARMLARLAAPGHIQRPRRPRPGGRQHSAKENPQQSITRTCLYREIHCKSHSTSIEMPLVALIGCGEPVVHYVRNARVACDRQRSRSIITCVRDSAWRRTEGGGRAVRAARTWRAWREAPRDGAVWRICRPAAPPRRPSSAKQKIHGKQPSCLYAKRTRALCKKFRRIERYATVNIHNTYMHSVNSLAILYLG